MKTIAAAILFREGRILICRRGEGGSCAFLWEFPGGKLEPGETPAECAVRECREELGVSVRLGPVFARTSYDYPEGSLSFIFYKGEILSGDPQKRVHPEMRWVRPSELTDYPFCPADRDVVQRLSRIKENL